MNTMRAGSPALADVLRSIRASLQDEVVPETSDRSQYVVRMACRLLEIAEREIEAGDTEARRLEHLLQTIGVTSEADLAAGLMTGGHDATDVAIRTFIRDLVRWRIGVARPDHPGVADLQP